MLDSLSKLAHSEVLQNRLQRTVNSSSTFPVPWCLGGQQAGQGPTHQLSLVFSLLLFHFFWSICNQFASSTKLRKTLTFLVFCFYLRRSLSTYSKCCLVPSEEIKHISPCMGPGFWRPVLIIFLLLLPHRDPHPASSHVLLSWNLGGWFLSP